MAYIIRTVCIMFSNFLNFQFQIFPGRSLGIEKENTGVPNHSNVRLPIKSIPNFLYAPIYFFQYFFEITGLQYYKNAIGACVVFDVTSKDSFEKCQQWVKELNEKAGAEIRIVIVGNKIDLEDH